MSSKEINKAWDFRSELWPPPVFDVERSPGKSINQVIHWYLKERRYVFNDLQNNSCLQFISIHDNKPLGGIGLWGVREYFGIFFSFWMCVCLIKSVWVPVGNFCPISFLYFPFPPFFFLPKQIVNFIESQQLLPGSWAQYHLNQPPSLLDPLSEPVGPFRVSNMRVNLRVQRTFLMLLNLL